LIAFLDTWKNEPSLSRRLLEKVGLATPQNAGYSVEGRLRATQMIYDAAFQHFSKAKHCQMSDQLTKPKLIDKIKARHSLVF